jgi:hypothetical protein
MRIRGRELIAILTLLLLQGICFADTVDNFDTPGTPYTSSAFGIGASPALAGGGVDGSEELVVAQGAGSDDSVAFNQTDLWTTGGIVANFVLESSPSPTPDATVDFILLNTANYGSTGAGPDVDPNDLPAVQDSLAISINLSADTVTTEYNYAAATDADPVMEGKELVNGLQTNVQIITLQLARAKQSGDIVLALALQDQLSQANTVLKAAQQLLANLIAAASKGDGTSAQNALQKIKLFYAKGQTILNNAKSSFGGNVTIQPGSQIEITPEPPADLPSGPIGLQVDINPLPNGSGSEVTLEEISPSGPPTILYDDEVANLFPYSSRVEFAGATVGAGDSVGVDNVDVAFNTLLPSVGASGGMLLGLAAIILRVGK